MSVVIDGTTGIGSPDLNITKTADTSSIVAEKQRLRDITTLVDAATTVEELKSITIG